MTGLIRLFAYPVYGHYENQVRFNMVVSILGCGWYGKGLAKALLKKDTLVKGSVTSTDSQHDLVALGIQPYAIKFDPNGDVIDPGFFDCDVLIISISPKFKSGGANDYLSKIHRVLNTCIQKEVKKVIYISSTGVYGEHNSDVDEFTDPNPDTEHGQILLEAERLFQKEQSLKTTIIRFGGLIGPGRHPGRFFAGKINIPNGLAPLNLIHQVDCVEITLSVIGQNAFGCLFNAVSPDHPAKADFYGEMSYKAMLPAPEFVKELLSWKQVNSINLNNILRYRFLYKQLKNYPFDPVQE